MKELQTHIKIDIPVVENQQQIKQLKKVKTKKIHRGHKFYELNLLTGLITEAKVETYSKVDKEGTHIKKKCIIKESCLYESALNIDNAAKHFKKRIKSLL